MKKLMLAAAVSLMAAGQSYAGSSEQHIVFVHGAHFTAASWQPVQEQLNGKHSTLAVDLPGRNDSIAAKKVDLALSAGYLCKSIGALSGSKILVGHSQGGAVVNAALNICPDEEISSVVYVTAVAPLDKAKVFGLLSKQDDENYFKGINYNESAKMLEIKSADEFAAVFAQDANQAQRDVMAKDAVDEPATIGSEKMSLNQERFAGIDKYYVFANQDKLISLSSQQKIAESIGVKDSFGVDSGHLPMLTQPARLAAILDEIAKR